jgi:hypothetical protein
MLKLGRLPGHIPVGLKDLRYYVAGPLPAAPASVPLPVNVTWGMLGNDQYEDCGVAGHEHGLMAAAQAAHDDETFPSQDQAIQYYLTYTGGQDTGVVLADFLAYVRKNGYYGHTLSAYAPLTTNDIPALQFAIYAFGYAYTGISVTQQMLNDFQGGVPWTMGSLAGSQLGDHCVPVIAYDSLYLYAITWGAIQAIAYPAWHSMADEVWLTLTSELDAGDGRGLNYAALQADLDRVAP